MTFQITKEWWIDPGDQFEHRIDEDKLILWQTGKTIVLVVFRLPEDTSKIDLLDQIQQRRPEDVLETFVSTKGEVVGLGYTRVIRVEQAQKRLALVTFTVSNTSCLQTAFYLDDPDDLDWAKSVWKNVVFHPTSDDVKAHP